jgi:CheY-like chemotaxis protein
MIMGEMENELGLSRRQLQRETQKGLEALASILWENHRVDTNASLETRSASVVPSPELENELDPLEVELNEWKLVRQTCSIHSLVNDTLWMLKPAMEQNKSLIKAEVPSTLPPVLVDSTLTRQALFKIMRLTIQNSGQNTSLTATPNDNFITLQLRNPDCLYCSDEHDWQTSERIIQDQGGELALENDPSIGFQITIRLPQAGQTHILVIDDNYATLQLFERYLTPHHYEVRKAQGGAEGLSMVSESLPDLIILDVMMPTMDGWQVLRNLKQNPTTKNIPVIVCSVLKEPDLATSLGATTYLKKPVDRLELLTTLERILHQ